MTVPRASFIRYTPGRSGSRLRVAASSGVTWRFYACAGSARLVAARSPDPQQMPRVHDGAVEHEDPSTKTASSSLRDPVSGRQDLAGVEIDVDESSRAAGG